MKLLSELQLEKQYATIKESSISGRWIHLEDIQPLIEKLPAFIRVEKLGASEEGRPIFKLRMGTGSKRILMWSQMHGNESTGTKAVFDFINYCVHFADTEVVQSVLKEVDLQIIPMLNPDGALAYTRVNSKEVDLNRDAVDQSAIESQLLRAELDGFNPQFCFNLHDQRTIFGVEGTDNPATISFLAPSEEVSRKLTQGRKETMDVIVAMNSLLQKLIPNGIGRYTDEFYPTATGDIFQKLGHNTILIEAGHYPEDYEREMVRKFNFYAILQGIFHISTQKTFENYEPYFSIPNNIKNFYDVIYRSKNNEKDIAYQYVERIESNKFALTLIKEKEGNLSTYLGHKEFKVID